MIYNHPFSRITPAQSWVFSCLCLVFAMVIIGGLTRLTESGLSIVEWKLVSGTLPPLSNTAWQHEFAAYQQSPQYRQVNRDMCLEEFQNIFWLEYLHRLLGRVVGLAFLLPLLFFAWKRLVPRWLLGRMAGGTLLVFLQGGVGWLMVASGLKDVPWVSPYRLALHLSLAVTLFGLLIITLQRLMAEENAAPPLPVLPPWLWHFSRAVLLALFLQIILGALVAGHRAGLLDNQFPLMNGNFLPDPLRSPLLRLTQWPNNPEILQFFHRWWAFFTAGLILSLCLQVYRTTTDRRLRRPALGAAFTVLLQLSLGVATLLLAVPVALGTLHQAVAILLFGWSTALTYVISKTRRSRDFP